MVIFLIDQSNMRPNERPYKAVKYQEYPTNQNQNNNPSRIYTVSNPTFPYLYNITIDKTLASEASCSMVTSSSSVRFFARSLSCTKK